MVLVVGMEEVCLGGGEGREAVLRPWLESKKSIEEKNGWDAAASTRRRV